MSDTEISIPKVRLTGRPRLRDETGTPTVSRAQPTAVPEIGLETRGANVLAPVIEIDRLYEAVPGTSSQMASALELLRYALDALSEAKKSENPMDADRSAQRFQVALPKLFAYRSVGEGYAVIINSLHFVFANLHGRPLAPDQLNVVWRTLRELRARPAMSLEQGIQHVEELEEHGLAVDPPELGELLEGPESLDNE